MIHRRFIDSNVFIYVLSKDPRYSQRALKILEEAEEGLYDAYTSSLVISQVLAYLERRCKDKAMYMFLEYLESGPISVIETTLQDFVEAKKLAMLYSLDFSSLWDDLVIASQMIKLGIEEIYSNDSDFDRIPRIRRIF